MTQVIIRRGTTVSDGARALKEALVAAGISAVIKTPANFQRPANPTLVINWGAREALPANIPGAVLNAPENLGPAQDKKRAFTLLREARFENIPDFWTHPPTAEQRGKDIIVERVTTTGQGGEGINIKRPDQPLTPNLPLYTRYIRKEIEIRVHVVKGEAIAVQQKRRREGAQQEGDGQLIRNYDNGWIFAVNDVNEAAAAAAKPVAIEACRLLGVDIGAVDIVIRKKDSKPFVLEVNTRPGIESDTVIAAYVNKLRTLIPAGAVRAAPRMVKPKAPAVAKKTPAPRRAAPPPVVRRDPYAIPAKDSNKKVVMRDGTTWKWITTRKGNRVWRQVA